MSSDAAIPNYRGLLEPRARPPEIPTGMPAKRKAEQMRTTETGDARGAEGEKDHEKGGSGRGHKKSRDLQVGPLNLHSGRLDINSERPVAQVQTSSEYTTPKPTQEAPSFVATHTTPLAPDDTDSHLNRDNRGRVNETDTKTATRGYPCNCSPSQATISTEVSLPRLISESYRQAQDIYYVLRLRVLTTTNSGTSKSPLSSVLVPLGSFHQQVYQSTYSPHILLALVHQFLDFLRAHFLLAPSQDIRLYLENPRIQKQGLMVAPVMAIVKSMILSHQPREADDGGIVVPDFMGCGNTVAVEFASRVGVTGPVVEPGPYVAKIMVCLRLPAGVITSPSHVMVTIRLDPPTYPAANLNTWMNVSGILSTLKMTLPFHDDFTRSRAGLLQIAKAEMGEKGYVWEQEPNLTLVLRFNGTELNDASSLTVGMFKSTPGHGGRWVELVAVGVLSWDVRPTSRVV